MCSNISNESPDWLNVKYAGLQSKLKVLVHHSSAFAPWSNYPWIKSVATTSFVASADCSLKRRIGERNKSHPRLLLDRFSPISFHAPSPPLPPPPPSFFYTRTIDSYYFLRRRDTSFISGINRPHVHFSFFFFCGIAFCYSINRSSLKRQKAAFNWRLKREREREASYKIMSVQRPSYFLINGIFVTFLERS